MQPLSFPCLCLLALLSLAVAESGTPHRPVAKAPLKLAHRQEPSDPCSAFTATVTSIAHASLSNAPNTQTPNNTSIATSTVLQTSVVTQTVNSTFRGVVTSVITRTESFTDVVSVTGADRETVYDGTTTTTTTLPPTTSTTYVSQVPNKHKRDIKTATTSTCDLPPPFTTDGKFCYVTTRIIPKVGSATCTPTTLTHFTTSTPGMTATITITNVVKQTSTVNVQTLLNQNTTSTHSTTATTDVFTTISTTATTTSINTEPVTTTSTVIETETPAPVVVTVEEFSIQARIDSCASDQYVSTHGKQLAADFSKTAISHFALRGDSITSLNGGAEDMVFYIQNMDEAHPIGTEYFGTSNSAGYTNLQCAFDDFNRAISCTGKDKPLTFWACSPSGFLWGSPTEEPPSSETQCERIRFAIEPPDGATAGCDDRPLPPEAPPANEDCSADAFALQIYSRNLSSNAFVTPVTDPNTVWHLRHTMTKTANYHLVDGFLEPVPLAYKDLVPWVELLTKRQRVELHHAPYANTKGYNLACVRTSCAADGVLRCTAGGVDFFWYSCGDEPNVKTGPAGAGNDDCSIYEMEIVSPV